MIEDDCIFGFSLFSTSMGWLPRPMAVSSGTQTDQVGLTENKLGNSTQEPQDMDGCYLKKRYDQVLLATLFWRRLMSSWVVLMSYCCCEFEEAIVPSSPLLECLGPQFCVHTRLTVLPRGRNPQRPVFGSAGR